MCPSAPGSYASEYNENEMTSTKKLSCIIFYCTKVTKIGYSGNIEAVSDLEALRSSFSINKHNIYAFSGKSSAPLLAKKSLV